MLNSFTADLISEPHLGQGRVVASSWVYGVNILKLFASINFPLIGQEFTALSFHIKEIYISCAEGTADKRQLRAQPVFT